MAWRAPHVYELYSNGNELGSGMYVIGNQALKSEHSYKWIASAEYSSPMVCVRLDGYLQWIENYIYDEPAHKNVVVVAGAFPSLPISRRVLISGASTSTYTLLLLPR